MTNLIENLARVLTDEELSSLKHRWTSASASSPLRIGTVCSGTDAPILALEHLIAVLNNDNCDCKIQMDHVFSCENVKFKRDFIMETTGPPLLFSDVTELASGRGVCHDGTTRDVPRDFHVLIAGTECVDFSSLSTSPKGLKGGGRSDVTFWSTHELAKKCKPAIVMLENVKKCPAEEMEKAFRDIGYVAAHTKVCTSDFLLPQSRSRAYFVFLHSEKARFVSPCTKDDWISTMERLGSKRTLLKNDKVLDWTDFLIGDRAKRKDAKKKGGRSKPLSESLDSKWLAEIRAIEKKEGLTPYGANNGRPYSDAAKNFPAIASLPDRAKMRLDVQCKRAMKAGIDPLAVPLLWNPAQQLRFTDSGVSSDGKPRTIAPCVTPKHEWIVSNRKGPLTGAEALALQGISVPKKVLSQFDCGQLRDLAGNAMSTTVVAAVFLATFLTAELIDDGSLKKRPVSSATTRGTQKKRSRTD
jgi:site-specific DNA-cytosine methylase